MDEQSVDEESVHEESLHERSKDQRMHVGLVHWSFTPCVGGVETHLWHFSRLLAAHGVDVTVFTGTPEPTTPSLSAPPVRSGAAGAGTIAIERHSGLDLAADGTRSPDEPELGQWFGELLAARGIRIVHGHNLHHFSAGPARALAELREELGLRLVHTYHSIWQEESNPAAEACRDWHLHFAVSDFLSEACTRQLGFEVERRYLGIDTAAYVDVPVSGVQEPGMVLLPARLIPDKGAELAIRAVHHVIEHGLSPRVTPRLVLMRTGTENTVDFHGETIGFYGELQKLLKDLKVKDGVVEFAEAGVDHMRKLYERASVVVYPSMFEEPMGLAPLEAMCAARPVVVTRMGGLDEGVEEDGEIGFLVPDRNVTKLADRIALLLDDPELARAVGLRAREHVVNHFDLERFYLEPMLDVYREQLGL
ncbi:glycosyltransferase family 4 protein [Streptomyces sp. NBC_01275]|uniref:glycosyltransferase family 4 protein n=1 Tax=Streptomyces sp. NBC_01275 TaxID=2903807 RepID=UPI002254988F|nr:glycosyltransferase family 4 protein [Streptomyces sp. NBC_01275]MCX4761129.1 glycosyltransferase family 4 protein [Streptomyces sp. NBC_01275]